MSFRPSTDNNDEDSNNNNNTTTPRRAKSLLQGVAAGYVATQQGLNGLLQELLGAVKQLRLKQKDQASCITQLQSRVQEQDDIIDELRREVRALRGNGTGREPSKLSSSTADASPTTATTINNAMITKDDLAQLRRELVGMIGSAMAQTEEDLETLEAKLNQQLLCKTSSSGGNNNNNNNNNGENGNTTTIITTALTSSTAAKNPKSKTTKVTKPASNNNNVGDGHQTKNNQQESEKNKAPQTRPKKKKMTMNTTKKQQAPVD